MSSPDDVNSEVEWRCARARILARRADHDRAVALARDAVAKAGESDFLEVQANAALTLAQALSGAGRGSEASAAAHEALDLNRLKGATAASSDVRRRCATLGIELDGEP